MSTNHLFYINSFKTYEPSAIKTNEQFSNLANYSTFINEKANEIFSIASSDSAVDIYQLRKEIVELGVIYVKLFVIIKRQNQ